MSGLRAILVCVDFADLLAVTLPYNRHHFSEVMVVTDTKSYLDVRNVAFPNSARVHVTDSFYDDGALFNKWKALEQGLDWLGREDWLCLMDVDILWPRYLPGPRTGTPMRGATWVEEACCIGNLYTPRRRMMENLNPRDPRYKGMLPDEGSWADLPLHPQQREFAGYTQIFHASDPVLGPPPWHETDWKHAGGADSFFQAKWPDERKVRPPFEVLHLGPAGQNWCGRVTPYLDGSFPQEAGKRASQLREMLFLRRGKTGRERFDHEKI